MVSSSPVSVQRSPGSPNRRCRWPQQTVAEFSVVSSAPLPGCRSPQCFALHRHRRDSSAPLPSTLHQHRHRRDSSALLPLIGFVSNVRTGATHLRRPRRPLCIVTGATHLRRFSSLRSASSNGATICAAPPHRFVRIVTGAHGQRRYNRRLDTMSQTVRGDRTTKRANPLSWWSSRDPDRRGRGRRHRLRVCHTDLTYREGGINDECPSALDTRPRASSSRRAAKSAVEPGDFVILKAVCGQCRACKRGTAPPLLRHLNAEQKIAGPTAPSSSVALARGLCR